MHHAPSVTRWNIPGRSPSEEELGHLASLLRGGGIAILPTDTLYGYHALASDTAAIGKISSIKGRETTKGMVVLAHEIGDFTRIGVVFSNETREMLEEIWPAPLTAILPLRAPIPASGGLATLAIRIPGLPWLRELAGRTGPLVSTSVNRSGESPRADVSQLDLGLTRDVELVVDAGLLAGEASTLIDLSTGEPKLVREGDVHFAQNLWKRLRKSL